MKVISAIIFCLLVQFDANISVAEEKSILIGMGNFEPYYIAKGETGIFAEVINAVFTKMPGYKPKYVFGLSNSDLWANYEAGRIDAVSNLFDSVKLDACRSDPTFRFRDVAISRLEDGLVIESVSDLKNLKIVSFQGAKEFFGPSFSAVVDPDRYIEVSKPGLQARMLMGGRYDISVGDLMVFLDQRRKLRTDSNGNNENITIAIHDIFPEIYSTMGFREEQLCQAFNAALAEVKASGEFDAIYRRYFNQLGY